VHRATDLVGAVTVYAKVLDSHTSTSGLVSVSDDVDASVMGVGIVIRVPLPAPARVVLFGMEMLALMV
jgi:hypothetical protein